MDGAPSTCAGCGVVRYCGAECQRKHWKSQKKLCTVVRKRRETIAGMSADSWPRANMSASPDGVPPLFPGRPAWVDDVPGFISSCHGALPPDFRGLPKARLESVITTFAHQVKLDEKSELPSLWRDVFGPDTRVSCADHLMLHRLAGFVLVVDGHVLALRLPKAGAVDTTDVMTRKEFEEMYLPILQPTTSDCYPVPPLCDNVACKRPAACRCSCNAAYCSRECQVTHWASHQRAHEAVEKANPALAQLTRIYWADRLKLSASAASH